MNILSSAGALFGAAALSAVLCLPRQSFAYPNSVAEDLVVDAPWRTIRDYLPVLFFTPEFSEHPGRKLISVSLQNYAPATQETAMVFIDSRGLLKPNRIDDQFPCAVRFIDPNGRARPPMGQLEPVQDFWHYIARVPVSCIGMGGERGRAGIHFLLGTMIWTDGDRVRRDSKVLRVVVAEQGFAKFSPVDHQYDIHVHTIAEQTKWHGTANPDASRKAFGGPVAMLLESAYALGMVEVQLRDANWAAFRDKIVTTDHNVFFSAPPNDAGTHPGGGGPTSATNGKEGEFRWYRNHLGALGGEEITVKGANGRPLSALPLQSSQGMITIDAGGGEYLALGSHLLSYGAPHVEGPWHGGALVRNRIREGVDNTVSITNALVRMGSTDGFGYAAHPESGDFGWSRDYYERAVGLPPYNVAGGDSPILQRRGDEFVFKGLQIWNAHADRRSRDSGDLEVSESHRFNPFTTADTSQRFVVKPGDWRRGHDHTFEAYKTLVKQGLRYSFAGRDEHVFVRKLYLSAGTDAHGDFNYELSLTATALAELGSFVNIDVNDLSATSNAFGRLRTYTLTSQRYVRAGAEIPPGCPTFPFCNGAQPAPSDFPLQDYTEGNTVVTDGPVGRFAADANCRFNSDVHRLSWHDGRCSWENHDGLIGGRGHFDGGNTLLAPVGNEGVLLSAQWIGKNDYLPEPAGRRGPMTFSFLRINPNVSAIDDDSGRVTAGPARSLHTIVLNEAFDRPAEIEFPRVTALLMQGQLGQMPDETRFITNPIWIAPYRIMIDSPGHCPMAPGELSVTVEFGLSMDTTLPAPPVSTAPTGPVVALADPRRRSAAGRFDHGTNQRQGSAPQAEVATTDEDVFDGLRVHVKPLNSIGNSGPLGQRVSGSHAQWGPVEIPREFAPRLIQNARYTTRNRQVIACAGAWDSKAHRSVAGQASYAIVIENIRDMHGNPLNAIGTAFTVQDRSGPRDPVREPLEPGTGQVVLPPPAPSERCQARDAQLCARHGATCELIGTRDVAEAALCRWGSRQSASACQRTAGLWTAVDSKYAKNHPGAVPAGAKGACISEARNLQRRVN